jgi:small subunit ribosomal protein S25e
LVEHHIIFSQHSKADNRSKGKVKDKAQHSVILDKATSDKLYKDVQSYRLITVATLVDRLKINGSLARRCLADLEEKGQIKKVVGHSKLSIYSMLSVESQNWMKANSRKARAVAAAE